MEKKEKKDWQLFYGDGKPHDNVNIKDNFPAPPPWREFHKINENEQKEINQRWSEIQQLANSEENERGRKRGANFRIHVEKTNSNEDEEKITEAGQEVLNAVNAAIYLRRPLLVTGNPGSGKTSLAYAIAHELNLGPVLTWSITARSTLQDGLYRYDAIGRLQDAEKISKDAENKQDQSIGDYITLGALGTAFLPSPLPRVLLIDEIDKSDINLPNDLLHIFEEGGFNIPELVRRVKDAEAKQTNTEKAFTSDGEIKATINRGKVRCAQFPIVIMTSNGEREFPPAFLRRCLRVIMPDPTTEALQNIVKAHFGEQAFQKTEVGISNLIKDFKEKEGDRATDQLLNAIHLLTNHISSEALDKNGLKELLFKPLSDSE